LGIEAYLVSFSEEKFLSVASGRLRLWFGLLVRMAWVLVKRLVAGVGLRDKWMLVQKIGVRSLRLLGLALLRGLHLVLEYLYACAIAVDPQFSTIEKIANSLKVNIVDLVAAEDIFKDVSAYDKTIVEKVQMVDLLDEQEKKGLFSIIDGLVAKQKLKQSLSSALNLAS
jgi:hypothetical protein